MEGGLSVQIIKDQCDFVLMVLSLANLDLNVHQDDHHVGITPDHIAVEDLAQGVESAKMGQPPVAKMGQSLSVQMGLYQGDDRLVQRNNQ